MRKSKEFVHEGKYAAEVAVDLIEDDTAWSPYLSPGDAHKLDTVRLALRRGDIRSEGDQGSVGPGHYHIVSGAGDRDVGIVDIGRREGHVTPLNRQRHIGGDHRGSLAALQ